MRLVMPAEFIRLPARMKKGTARSGNESSPPTRRGLTGGVGRRRATIAEPSDAPAMAIATGRPEAMSPRNISLKVPGPIRISLSFHLVRKFGLFEHRISPLPVVDAHADGAPGHEHEAEGDEAVKDADRPVDDRHALAADLLHEGDGEVDAVAEEEDTQAINEDRKGARHIARQQAVEKVHLNVVVLAHVARRADECDRDQQVARDLLGPRRRVVERVAGEELVEDHDREHPEDGERGPVLEAVVREVDGFVVDVELARGVQHMFLGLGAHLRFFFSQLLLKRLAAWSMWRRMAARAAEPSWRAIAATISRCSSIATPHSSGVSKWCSRRRNSGPVRWSQSVFTTSASALVPLPSAMRR